LNLLFVMSDIRAVVVTYNSEGTIEGCLEGLMRDRDKGIISDIVVVDNASCDRTRSILRSKYSEVKLVEPFKNIGYGSACNLGVKDAKTKYILFLNPDLVVPEGAIPKMVSFLDGNPSVAVVGGWLEDEKGIPNYSFRRFPSLSMAFFHRESPVRRILSKIGITGGYITHLKPPEKPIEVDWVLGAFMMVRRDIFDEIGGFDEGFFLYQEDVDLCYRLKLMGYSVYHLPDVRITHYFEHSTKRRPYLRIISKHKSLYRFLKKTNRLIVLDEIFVVPLFVFNLIISLSTELLRFLLSSEE